MYFVNGYLLASSLNNPVRVFNLTAFSFVSSFVFNETLTTGVLLQSKAVFVFGTASGKLGYFSINALPNPTPTYLYNDPTI